MWVRYNKDFGIDSRSIGNDKNIEIFYFINKITSLCLVFQNRSEDASIFIFGISTIAV